MLICDACRIPDGVIPVRVKVIDHPDDPKRSPDDCRPRGLDMDLCERCYGRLREIVSTALDTLQAHAKREKRYAES